MVTPRTGLVLTLFFLAIPCCALAKPGDDAAALEAAQRRQEFAKTWEVRFTLTEFLVKGGQSAFAPGPFKANHAVPDKDMTITSTNRIACDGTKIRIEYNHPQWHMPEGKLYWTTFLGIGDDNGAKDFYAKGRGPDEEPQGTIRFGAPCFANDLSLFPIFAAFRPLSRRLSRNYLGELKATGVALPIGGDTCFEYAMGRLRTQSYWLDPGRDYLIRRIASGSQDRVRIQTDISYGKQVTSSVWVPQSWISNTYAANGALLSSIRAKVQMVRVHDALPSSEFDFRFPPGTIVIDETDNGKWYRVAEGAEMHEISPFTRQEVGWSSIDQPGDPWYRRHTKMLASVVLATGALILIYFRRRATAGHT